MVNLTVQTPFILWGLLSIFTIGDLRSTKNSLLWHTWLGNALSKVHILLGRGDLYFQNIPQNIQLQT